MPRRINPIRIDPQLMTSPVMYGSAGEPTLGDLPPVYGRTMRPSAGPMGSPMGIPIGLLMAGLFNSRNADAPQTQVASGPYDTPLSPPEEIGFQQWKAKNAPHDSGQDYDLRGAYKAGLTPAANGHWADTYKKPNHPTFSDQSQYAAYGTPGRWEGEKFIAPAPKEMATLDIMPNSLPFGKAFATARKMGLVEFTWRGANYTTKYKEE